jgi:glycosyltransferase involved in cell wall biosynthesis
VRVCLAHPTGNSFVRAAVRALHAAGWLHRFYTTIAAPDPSRLQWAPTRLRNEVLRRRPPEVPSALIRTHPWRESVRLGALALNVQSLTRRGAWAGIDAVYEGFDRHVARQIARLSAPISAVYAYEDAAEQTFLAARERGAATVYELPIAYWETTQRLLREEAARLPEWRETLRGIDDSDEKLARKVREIELADTVVVPSRFVLDTLPPHIRRNKRCLVAPFGSPAPQRGSGGAPEAGTGRPLRVLFAGAMSQRKGLADLFAAMRLLNRPDVELVVMGSPLAPMQFYRRQFPDFIYEPPRAHAEVLTLMRGCDILALPAIVEGRALVQQEALASGLPLLVTANAGAEDLIDEGLTGFIVPIRSPQALAERLAWFADHRALLPGMRRCALAKAAETGWAQYEASVCEAAAPSTPFKVAASSGTSTR